VVLFHFISRAKKGAQYEPAIRPPDPVEMEELASVGRGWVRIVDYAPEEDEGGHFLAKAVQLGILARIGPRPFAWQHVPRPGLLALPSAKEA